MLNTFYEIIYYLYQMQDVTERYTKQHKVGQNTTTCISLICMLPYNTLSSEINGIRKHNF